MIKKVYQVYLFVYYIQFLLLLKRLTFKVIMKSMHVLNSPYYNFTSRYCPNLNHP